MTAATIFDVKTLRMDKAGTYYPTFLERMYRQAVEIKFGTVRRDYMHRTEKLDNTCTHNNGTSLFSIALTNKFKSGGVTRLSSAHLKRCARYAAAKAENAELTPLNHGQLGEIYYTMLTQYKREIRVLAVWTASETKIRRICFISLIVEEADAISHPQESR